MTVASLAFVVLLAPTSAERLATNVDHGAVHDRPPLGQLDVMLAQNQRLVHHQAYPQR